MGSFIEQPVHLVFLDTYNIDKYEVTVSQYKKCYDAGKCKKPRTGTRFNWGKSGRENHPINGVSWKDANSYCRYVDRRLPTEAEWEKAASWRNGKKYKYASGKKSVSCKYVVMRIGDYGCGKLRTWDIGSKPPEINKTYDMGGNVSEWVSDWYRKYTSRKQRNPKGLPHGSTRVIRGGSWIDGIMPLRVGFRSGSDPLDQLNFVGFRCASSP